MLELDEEIDSSDEDCAQDWEDTAVSSQSIQLL